MLIGDLLLRFEDPRLAAEALRSLGDQALTAQVTSAAAEEVLTPGEFTVRSVERFAARADGKSWTNLVGLLSRSADPDRVFLRSVLTDELAQRPH